MMFIIYFTLLLFSKFCFGEVIHGIVSSKDGFAFLGKFCFDYTLIEDQSVGSVEVELKKKAVTEQIKDLDILEYDDESISWPRIYNRGYTNIPCAQKRYIAKNWNNLTGKSSIRVKWDNNSEYSSTNSHLTEHLRPRFWYIAMANCETFTNIEYTITFKNVLYSPFNEQFGRDIVGLNTLYLIFVGVYIIIGLVHCVSIIKHWAESGYLHPILKLYSASLFFQFLALVFYAGHYYKFSLDGKSTAMDEIGECLDVLARLLLILLLLLLAQGWTISTANLKGKKMLFAVCGIFFVLKITIIIWRSTSLDPAGTSIPTKYAILLYMLNGVWLLFGCYFLYSVFQSHKFEGNSVKRELYKKLGAFYGPWMIGLPVLVFLILLVDPWDREISVRGFDLCLTFLANLGMLYLMWPSRALNYFSIALPTVNEYLPAFSMNGANQDL